MGTGVGMVDSMKAAGVMVAVIRNFNGTTIEEVILVGLEKEMFEAFQKAAE